MKKTIYIAGIILLTLNACRTTRTNQEAPPLSDEYTQEEVTYQTFYDGLSPYGNWIDYPGIGYAWTPNEAGFRPYYNNGYWAYTNAGWTWVSNYSWGWAPFHYGRWFNDPFYGWVWAPGYEWAPAWVNWRGNNNMYGWAPLAPSGFGGYNDIPYNNWTFVPCQYINSHNGHQYYQQGSQVYVNNTTIINNYNRVPVVRNPRNAAGPVDVNNKPEKNTYAAGPAVRDVEKITNTTIKPLAIQDKKTPEKDEVTANSIKIYKPGVKSQQANNTVRPANVMPYKKEPADQNNPAINNANNQQPVRNNDRDNIKQPDPGLNQPVIDNNKTPQPATKEAREPVVKQPDPRQNQPVMDNNKAPQPPKEVTVPVVKQPAAIDNNKPVPQRQPNQTNPPRPVLKQPATDFNKMPQRQNMNTEKPPVRPIQNPPAQRQTPVQQQPARTPNPVYRRAVTAPRPQTNYPRQHNVERSNNNNRNGNPAPATKKPN